MGVIAAVALGVGAAAVAGGSYLNANAAKKRQKFTQYIADTPGVNYGDTYNETLGAAQGATPQAEALASGQNTFNQSEVDRLLETSIPGYREGQVKRTQNALSLLNGDIPQDVSAQVARHSAGEAIDGGFAGSGASRNLTARDLGRTSLDLQGLGNQQFASIIGSTPMASRVSSGSFLNIDPATGLRTRSNERTQKMDILLKKAGLKGATETYGEGLTQIGSSLLSYGMGSMGGGGMTGGAGGTGPWGTQTQGALNEYYGTSGVRY